MPFSMHAATISSRDLRTFKFTFMSFVKRCLQLATYFKLLNPQRAHSLISEALAPLKRFGKGKSELDSPQKNPIWRGKSFISLTSFFEAFAISQGVMMDASGLVTFGSSISAYSISGSMLSYRRVMALTASSHRKGFFQLQLSACTSYSTNSFFEIAEMRSLIQSKAFTISDQSLPLSPDSAWP